ncbi:hypothetical protein ACFVHS_32195 [Streptomyces sp. NPDC057746]|uniref:putative antirestriction adenine methyltransferase n=1 Tax=Streptomyces sp. NPDC057746 TaxID=3346237 RepID=UPI0036972CB4
MAAGTIPSGACHDRPLLDAHVPSPATVAGLLSRQADSARPSGSWPTTTASRPRGLAEVNHASEDGDEAESRRTRLGSFFTGNVCDYLDREVLADAPMVRFPPFYPEEYQAQFASVGAAFDRHGSPRSSTSTRQLQLHRRCPGRRRRTPATRTGHARTGRGRRGHRAGSSPAPHAREVAASSAGRPSVPLRLLPRAGSSMASVPTPPLMCPSTHGIWATSRRHSTGVHVDSRSDHQSSTSCLLLIRVSASPPYAPRL